MSLGATVWAFKQKLPAAEKLILIALSEESGMDGNDWHCWPLGYTDTMAELSGIDLPAALTRLQEWGFIIPNEPTSTYLLSQGAAS